tara:strand:- start:23271 stop:23987 length:717 start_codon:yes stop_codon:yes gene_type:complete
LGVEILEAYDDDKKEFFVVNDRICIYHRGPDWAALHEKSELADKVKEEVKVPYQCVLLASPESYGDLSEFRSQVSSLSKQKIIPQFVSIILPNVAVGGSQMYDTNLEIENIMKQYPELQWRIQNILREDISPRSAIDLAVDSIYFKKKVMFYIVFESGLEIPESFSEELNDALFKDEIKPAFARAAVGMHGLLVNRTLHRKHTGNAFNISVETKIENLEENSEPYIYNITDICPSLKQ